MYVRQRARNTIRLHLAPADTNDQQVLDTPEPLRNLADLIAAQLEYHKKAYEILSELAPVVDQLQVEQEVRRHESDF